MAANFFIAVSIEEPAARSGLTNIFRAATRRFPSSAIGDPSSSRITAKRSIGFNPFLAMCLASARSFPGPVAVSAANAWRWLAASACRGLMPSSLRSATEIDSSTAIVALIIDANPRSGDTLPHDLRRQSAAHRLRWWSMGSAMS